MGWVWIRALKCCIARNHKQWDRALHNKLGPVLGSGTLAWNPGVEPYSGVLT